MKIRNPSTRLHLSIPSHAQVLDVGSGHNPHPRANVLTDKFANDNYHRCGDVKVLKHQKFVEASGESLPFQDKEFDYVICSHVAEPATLRRPPCWENTWHPRNPING
jgi:hypothetical protein